MKENEIDTSYYEKTDFSSLIKSSKKKTISPAKTKRITMNISEIAYDEAHEIDQYLNMGYQNVLKTAIILGLNDLYQKINTNKSMPVRKG